MNVEEAREAIGVLKSEIERYEAMKLTADSWVFLGRRLDAVREMRDYLLGALYAARNTESAEERREIIEEAFLELHVSVTDTALKPAWFTNPSAGGEEVHSEKDQGYRLDKIRAMFERSRR